MELEQLEEEVQVQVGIFGGVGTSGLVVAPLVLFLHGVRVGWKLETFSIIYADSTSSAAVPNSALQHLIFCSHI